jgi:hypothetical protein
MQATLERKELISFASTSMHVGFSEFSDVDRTRDHFNRAAIKNGASKWIAWWFAQAITRNFAQSSYAHVGDANVAVCAMLNDHFDLWDSNHAVAMAAAALAEYLGFRYDSHADTIRMFRKLNRAIKKHLYTSPKDMVPRKSSSEASDKLFKETMAMITRWRNALQIMTGVLRLGDVDEDLDCVGWPPLYAPVFLPALCVDLFMSSRETKTLAHIVKVGINDGGEEHQLSYSLSDLWPILQELARMGASERMIRKFVERHDLHVLVWLSEYYGNVIDRSTFSQIAMRPQIIRDLTREQTADLIREWKKVTGVRLDKFAEYGTAEAYQASITPEPEYSWLSRDEDTEEIPAHPILTGRLIHPSKPEPEPEPQLVPDGLDWDWIMAELQVEDVLPDLDARLVRITIVHGLLRQGDRISSMDRLPVRDRKRIWKQCRDAGCSSSELDRIRSDLEERGLILRKHGKYTLARQVSVADKLHVLHDRIRELSEKYAK